MLSYGICVISLMSRASGWEVVRSAGPLVMVETFRLDAATLITLLPRRVTSNSEEGAAVLYSRCMEFDSTFSIRRT